MPCSSEADIDTNTSGTTLESSSTADTRGVPAIPGYVYFDRLDMYLDPENARQVLNDYHDELNRTMHTMQRAQNNFQKLNNLNRCNMSMLRKEMEGNWLSYL